MIYWNCHVVNSSGFNLNNMGFHKFNHRQGKLEFELGNSII
jgi:hypothetical protein